MFASMISKHKQAYPLPFLFIPISWLLVEYYWLSVLMDNWLLRVFKLCWFEINFWNVFSEWQHGDKCVSKWELCLDFCKEVWMDLRNVSNRLNSVSRLGEIVFVLEIGYMLSWWWLTHQIVGLLQAPASKVLPKETMLNEKDFLVHTMSAYVVE